MKRCLRADPVPAPGGRRLAWLAGALILLPAARPAPLSGAPRSHTPSGPPEVTSLEASPASGPTREFRALWADAFHPGFKTGAEVARMVADARAGHFNALIVEVRKRGDAYYQSQYEPRAADIAAGYDPLAEVIAQAHRGSPRLEVHAWIVTFPIWNQSSAKPAAGHVFNTHPDWLLQDSAGATWDGSNYQLDPGHPAVQQYTLNVALDLVSRYDVDGFHFDYVRYPGTSWGYHPVAVARFNRRQGRTGLPAATDPQWLQWRRDQVTALVRRVYLSALALKPQLKLSAATITWAPGITTDAEWTGSAAYSSVLQDWRAWMQEGILDLNAPMAYFRQHTHAADWASWIQFAKDHRYQRHVAIGAGLYLNYLSNSLAQLRATRLATPAGNRADGMAGYSYASTSLDAGSADFFEALVRPSAFDTEAVPVFEAAVATPDMPWKSSPQKGHLKGIVTHRLTGQGLEDASVALAGPSPRTVSADGNGFYGAVDLLPGSYTLRVSYPGLSSQTGAVTVAAGRVTTQDSQLSPPAGELFLVNVAATPGPREAVVTWQTVAAAATWLEWGASTNATQPAWATSAGVTNHCASIPGLQVDSLYWFRLVARTATDELRSGWRSFRTAGQVVVDNPLASYSGAWFLGTSATDKYAADYQYASTAASATATATFAPDLATPGLYDLYVWYPQGSNRSASAPFEIVFDGGSRTVRLDQTSGGGQWRLVAGRLHFRRGAAGFVRLSNGTGESGKVVMADAVRWVYASGQDPVPAGQVPEWWAVHFFGRSANGAADEDGDGQTDRAEYLLGTDPTRPSEALTLRPEAAAPTGLRLGFRPCPTGRTYRLLQSPSLVAGTWEPAAGARLVVLSEGNGRFDLSNLPPGPAFYRLEIDAP